MVWLVLTKISDALQIPYRSLVMVLCSSRHVTNSSRGSWSVNVNSALKHFRSQYQVCLQASSLTILKISSLFSSTKKQRGISRRGLFSRNVPLIYSVPLTGSCIALRIALKTNHEVGNGIINADGELWKIQRKAGMHFLNNANLNVLTSLALPQYLQKASKTLKTLRKQQIINLEDIFLELTTQIMGKMAYNVCYIVIMEASTKNHW